MKNIYAHCKRCDKSVAYLIVMDHVRAVVPYCKEHLVMPPSYTGFRMFKMKDHGSCFGADCEACHHPITVHPLACVKVGDVGCVHTEPLEGGKVEVCSCPGYVYKGMKEVEHK